MNRIFAALAGLLLIASLGHAQTGGARPGAPIGGTGGLGGGFNSSPGLSGGIGNSMGSPSFSPYLNLTRGGNSAAVNYYGIVRPQQNFAGALQGLQSQFSAGGQNNDDAVSQGVTVGTRVRFLNTNGYFQNMNGGTTTASGAGAGLGSPPPVNRPNAGSVGGMGNSTLRGGVGGNQSGAFGSSGGTRGPRN